MERGLADLQPDSCFPNGQPFGDHTAGARQLLAVDDRLATALAASCCSGIAPSAGAPTDQVTLELAECGEEMEYAC